MNGLVEIAIFLLVTWPIASTLGWLSVQDLRPHRPFNWRIYLGPVAYGRWIDERVAR